MDVTHTRSGLERDTVALSILSGIMSNAHRWADIERRYREGSLSYAACNKANIEKAFSIADDFIKHSYTQVEQNNG